MEDMKYLAGMLAGSRAKTDGNPKLGYMATFPIPEELRLGNAFTLGMRRRPARSVRWTCAGSTPGTTRSRRRTAPPRCLMPARRSSSPAPTRRPADVAQEKGKWGITYDHPASARSSAA